MGRVSGRVEATVAATVAAAAAAASEAARMAPRASSRMKKAGMSLPRQLGGFASVLANSVVEQQRWQEEEGAAGRRRFGGGSPDAALPVRRDPQTRVRARAFQLLNNTPAERREAKEIVQGWVDQGVGKSRHEREQVGALLLKYCRFVIRDTGGAPRMLIVEPAVRLDKIAPELDSLPAKVDFEGSLRAPNTRLRSVPQGLNVKGALDLSGCEELETVGAGLQVGATLDLSGCTALRAVGPGLVAGALCLNNCLALRLLPRELVCNGDALLEGCVALAELPPAWRVSGSLVLRGCTSLREVGAWDSLGNGLNCSGCTVLETLPDPLEVSGTLTLKGCAGLRALPERVHVQDYLNLTGCAGLESLPQEAFAVGGDIYLEGCLALRSLGPRILEWGERSIGGGGPHNVFLGGSGVTEAELEWLRDEEPPHLRFYLSRRRVESTMRQREGGSEAPFSSIKEAARFWLELAGLDTTALDPDVLAESVDKGSERGVLLFLTKLLDSKEFKQAATERALARRVVEVLATVCSEVAARDELLARMVDSVDACSDKPIWAMNQMKVVIEAARARGDEQQLRRVGLGVMRLDVVHRHVENKIRSLAFVDDVCVYLRFEIALREELGLPVSAVEMNFPNYIKVSEREIAKCRKEALAITPDQFEAWLQTWPEWQKHLRARFADSALADWSALPLADRRASASLTTVLGNPVDDPVLLMSSIWSLEDLVRHWVETGMDLNGTSVSVEQMGALRRCAGMGEAVPDAQPPPLPARGEGRLAGLAGWFSGSSSTSLG